MFLDENGNVIEGKALPLLLPLSSRYASRSLSKYRKWYFTH
jgi:hypothetical protein